MPTIPSALERQRAIYSRGISGARPSIPLRAEDLRESAKRKMSATAWAYIDGGAGGEVTIAANAAAFARRAIRPHMMRSKEAANFSCSLFGTSLPFPLLLAPIGAMDLICRGADRMVARAAAETGVPFIFSNQAGTPMEVCAADMGS
ncbi:MAG TPA: alpha-hydroxy-acid oxidizing protein, partial [Puia sp.]|nr:alpha-hydroxy-acid oxidizing protein [Puia sp.]